MLLLFEWYSRHEIRESGELKNGKKKHKKRLPE